MTKEAIHISADGFVSIRPGVTDNELLDCIRLAESATGERVFVDESTPRPKLVKAAYYLATCYRDDFNAQKKRD